MKKATNIDQILGSLSPILVPIDNNASQSSNSDHIFDLHDRSDLEQLGSRWDEIIRDWNNDQEQK